MKRGVLLFVTSEMCGACKFYKIKTENGWNELQSKIMQMGEIELVEIALPAQNRETLPQGYPSKLKKYISWYPTFILIPWHNYYDPQIMDLQGQVYAGMWSNERKEYIPTSEFRLNNKDILGWVKETVMDDKFGKSLVIHEKKILPEGFKIKGEVWITDGGKPVGKIEVEKDKKVGKFRKARVWKK